MFVDVDSRSRNGRRSHQRASNDQKDVHSRRRGAGGGRSGGLASTRTRARARNDGVGRRVRPRGAGGSREGQSRVVRGRRRRRRRRVRGNRIDRRTRQRAVPRPPPRRPASSLPSPPLDDSRRRDCAFCTDSTRRSCPEATTTCARLPFPSLPSRGSSPRASRLGCPYFFRASIGSTRLVIHHPGPPPSLAQASLDAAAKGLFYADPDDTAAARAAASRRERASVAACRLAFCERPSTRRWLATQETALFAARLRLGELELELGATEDETSTVAPPPPRPGHRWVPFERARSLLRRRVVEVARGWCAVPTDALSVVAVDDADARLRRELEVTARRLEFMRASRGGGGNDCNGSGGGVSPGLEPLLRKLAAWRPGREELDAYLGGVAARREGDRRDGDARAEALHASTSGGGGGRGWGGSDASAGTGRGVWRRGWRKRRDGGGATAASSLAEDFDFARAGATADAFNRLPTTAYFTELGADAKRVLRALKRGVDGATGRPFPLCMRRHLRDLRADRHLKHDARFQARGPIISHRFPYDRVRRRELHS